MTEKVKPLQGELKTENTVVQTDAHKNCADS